MQAPSLTDIQQNTPDLTTFIEQINALPNNAYPEIRRLFDREKEIVIARAPGRLDLMGGIADYSGSLVLQLPIREATFAAVQKSPDRVIQIVSMGEDRQAEMACFTLPIDHFENKNDPIPYEMARAYFQQYPDHGWAAYIAGAFLVLMRERAIAFREGARIFIQSNVPEGKGVSSSAAVEVATMMALSTLFDLQIEPREMALLCQKVENLVVGAPCGVMDQMTSVCGRADALLALHCQPAELQAPLALPHALAVWGIDSGIRHAVSGSDYTAVRVGAFMGYRILLEMAKSPDTGNDSQETNWDGYLANIAPSAFLQNYEMLIPERMKGSDFLAQYDDTTDHVTQVDPSRIYAVRHPTRHPINEHFRVRTFAHLLQGDPIANAPLLGECMYQSHASYSACGLGSTGTDALVKLARQSGPAKGIYGAKITGGGSGGTVAILGRQDAGPVVYQIAETYRKMTGKEPYIFAGSSPGAKLFGTVGLG